MRIINENARMSIQSILLAQLLPYSMYVHFIKIPFATPSNLLQCYGLDSVHLWDHLSHAEANEGQRKGHKEVSQVRHQYEALK